MSEAVVYLDHAATTPIDPRVAVKMASSPFANPSSIHVAGRSAAAAVANAKQQFATLLGCTAEELILTSGATESNNLAIAGAARFRAHRGKHLVTSLTEHKAVTDTFTALVREGFEVTWLSPQQDGSLTTDQVCAALRDDTQLVSLMHVNNETGVIHDLADIGSLCRDRDVLFHTDAAQSVGKIPLNLHDLPVDFLSLTAHKFYGPPGIGVLYVADRPACRVLPIMYGGGQQGKLRPGTLPVSLIVGAGEAAAVALADMSADQQHTSQLRNRLLNGLGKIPGVIHNSVADNSYPGIINVSIEGVEGESLMLALEPVCVASGSACNAVSGESSYVLRALGRSDRLVQSAIRFSFGRGTTLADIDFAVSRLEWGINHLRSIALQADPGT